MHNYKWCAIDAEGDAGKQGLKGVAFFSDAAESYETDHGIIRNMLLDHAYGGYTFIAHNAEYDLSVIFWQLGIPMKAVYFNGRFNRGEWRYDTRKPLAQLWDTLALSGGIALARLGDALGLPKYPTPQRLLGIDPDRYEWQCERHKAWECLSCYAVRDAEICHTFMAGLEATCNAWGVEPHRRLSGLASAVWRSLDNPEPIALNNYRIEKLARRSYHGGRVETFKLGNVAPLYTADVTSMYPFIMQSTPYPCARHMVHVNNPQDRETLLTYEGVSHVLITIPPMHVPPLPYKHKGELHYPVGTIQGIWTHLELRYAVSLGCAIKRVYESAYATESLYPFASFIGTLWAMREEYITTKDPRSLFAKLLMNNLYGYLGMKGQLERADIYLAEPGTLLRKQPKTSWFSEEGRLYLTYERNQPSGNKWSNVLWASQTTAAARVRLHQYLLMQGNALAYCDTDSVFSTMPIVGVGEGLGQLRSDGDYMAGIIAAPKLYAVQEFSGEWKAKAKGVSRACALQFLRTGVATFSAPIKPRSQGRRNIAAGTWVDVTRTYQNVPARRQPIDPHALLSDSGMSDTSPLVVFP